MHRYGRDYRTHGWEARDHGSRGPGAHMYDYRQGYGRGGYDRGMQGWGGYMRGHQGGYDRGYGYGRGMYDRDMSERGNWDAGESSYGGGYGGRHMGPMHGRDRGGDRYYRGTSGYDRADYLHPRATHGDGPIAGFDRPFFDHTTQDTVRRMALAPWNTPVPGMGVGYSLGHGVGRGRWL